MNIDLRALAAKAQGWMSYGLGKVLSLLKWAWEKLCGAGNYVIDPPPMHLKRLFWIVLPVVIGVWAHGAYSGYSVGSWVKDQLGWGEVRIQPLLTMPRLPSVVTTTLPPPASDLAPVVSPPAPEVKNAQAVPVSAPKAEKKKRKAKEAKVDRPISGF